MNVNIQTVRFVADGKLRNYILKKMDKLPTFYDKIFKADVYLKLENLGQTIKDKTVEISVQAPRQTFFIKHTSKSFEESFDLALSSMVNKVKREKEKIALRA